MNGKLYLVATPIGNLEDITLRAIKILKEVDIIVAEDTRQTLKLLNHLEIQKHLISYHRHSDEQKQNEIIEEIKSGKNIALVTDAGTPVISDPGEDIVKKALEENIQVIPVPGPCALIAALIASGIDAKEFSFFGFLPMNKKLRNKKLEEIKKAKITVILYEAPHKLISTLKDLNNVTGNRKIVLARELTKIHEEFISGTAEELLERVIEPRGEYVIVIDKAEELEKNIFEDMTVEEHYNFYVGTYGMSKNDAIKQVAKDRGTKKNEIYKNFLNK